MKLRIHKNSVSNKNNFLQRKCSLLINIKSKYEKYENIIDENINIDFSQITKLLDNKDKDVLNFINSRLFVLLYDKIKTYSLLDIMLEHCI